MEEEVAEAEAATSCDVDVVSPFVGGSSSEGE